MEGSVNVGAISPREVEDTLTPEFFFSFRREKGITVMLEISPVKVKLNRLLCANM